MAKRTRLSNEDRAYAESKRAKFLPTPCLYCGVRALLKFVLPNLGKNATTYCTNCGREQ